ncbi:MAG: hypothetical protein SOS22_04480 [Absicoccus sp.]|nr:hypothetical protein [Absicoccus sp.]MDY3035456.1 hypothetical protein [Absicoccus sp.]
MAKNTKKQTDKLLEAAKEAKQISRDPNVPGYTNMDDLKKALEE